MYSVVLFRTSIMGPKRYYEQEASSEAGARRVAAKLLARYPVGTDVIVNKAQTESIERCVLVNRDTGESERLA